MALGALETGPVRRLLFGLVDRRLLESVHLCDGHELRVFDRGRSFAYRWQSIYGRRETTVPLANISAVGWDDGGDDGSTGTLTVSTAGGDSSWAFTRDNASPGPTASGCDRSPRARAEGVRPSPRYEARLGASQRSASATDQPLRAA